MESTTTIHDYINHLKYHDWFFQYSDDHSVWTRGNRARQQLLREQKELDPDWSIWNQHAPDECKVKVSA